jgi:hypothetical protein
MFPHEFWRTVALIDVGGIVGGSLYWTSAYLSHVVRSPDDASIDQWSGSWQFWLANAFTGVGGAWAVLLAMLWASRAPLGSDAKEMLELIGTAIVAGYAGNRVLPAVADRLLKELIENATKTTMAAAKSAKTQADSAKQSRMVSEILAYLDSKGNQTDHQTDDYIAQLRATLSLDPTFRSAAILLARILDESKKDTAGAIEVLTAFIDAKSKAGGKDDSDVADAYWNLANYYEEEFKAGGGEDTSLRKKAIDSLQVSLKILPAYSESLKADPDFQDLLADPASKSLPLGE